MGKLLDLERQRVKGVKDHLLKQETLRKLQRTETVLNRLRGSESSSRRLSMIDAKVEQTHKGLNVKTTRENIEFLGELVKDTFTAS